MRKRTKEIVFKTVVVLGVASMLLLFPGCLIWAFMITDARIGEGVAYGLLASCFVFGLTTCIMLPFCYDVVQKPQRADTYSCVYRTYDEFMRALTAILELKTYQKLCEELSDKLHMTEVHLYAKHERKQSLLCCAIIRCTKLTEPSLEEINTKITKALYEAYGESAYYKTINVISIFCVDRVHSTLRNLLSSPLRQGWKNGRIIAGITFGGKKIYIAKQKGGRAFYKYKYLRTELMELLNIHVE